MATAALGTGDPGDPPIGGGGYVPLRSPPLAPSCSDAIFDAINARRLQYLRSFHLNYIIK